MDRSRRRSGKERFPVATLASKQDMVNNREREVSIEVVSRHQNVSDKTRDFATEKAQRLTKFHSRISRIQVMLDERHDDFVTEIVAHVEAGATVVAKEAGSGYRASITAAADKLERQLKRDKEKRHNHKADPLGKSSESEKIDDSEDSYDDIIQKDLS